ncbi:MAG: hypothetical protein A2600_11015 [Candidatus Lambdaproteobacteria bacterium RIFOXYD1_FULL_56_27]|uniref:DUF2946 domain-containing protein n=1 Tax=Candidatus Lambdaproteobacteria bacterium RIFOXYD2_FULL_56_26 TaxID=1817773 RepID=A0A1F6H1K5_9PROT|nr:MAG: hypothetical protein A2557_10760 [Candidatus Lambdaproteobacteria bacterium RIFOXYD2_FULL_56_26]OGH05698.1 MAG: hypothetical protein A2426_04170 [Candidatus Lambdaproteobacteria bacterium RIFOXYC1_FULL_56_13]OGH08435.1 MAG: hypothetical protein A2600_11015 [Candidatus Lambdaproteobacteria bacterium RIFOXYD1_FULL_56_27]
MVFCSVTLVVGLFGLPSLCRRLPARWQASGVVVNPPDPTSLEVCGTKSEEDPKADTESKSQNLDLCSYCQLGQGLDNWQKAVLQAPLPVFQARPTPFVWAKPRSLSLCSNPGRGPPALV